MSSSAENVLVLESIAAGTQWAGTQTTKDVVNTFFDGSFWMTYRDMNTGTPHWDFVRLSPDLVFQDCAHKVQSRSLDEPSRILLQTNGEHLSSPTTSMYTESSVHLTLVLVVVSS